VDTRVAARVEAFRQEQVEATSVLLLCVSALLFTKLGLHRLAEQADAVDTSDHNERVRTRIKAQLVRELRFSTRPRESEREHLGWAHTGGGNALAFKQPPRCDRVMPYQFECHVLTHTAIAGWAC
jgi:hypothetical protein